MLRYISVFSILAGVLLSVSAAVKGEAQTLTTYGTPGILETPSAEMMPDGHLALTAFGSDGTLRTTLTFQMLPWVHGSFRYAIISDLDGGGAVTRYDRSFDLHFLLREESRYAPAVAVGLRDFGGTGIYASEYLVATKTFSDRLKLSGGIAWGRMAGRGSFKNPLSIFGGRFEKRPNVFESGVSQQPNTGQLSFGNWFRGEAALFAGADWAVSKRLNLLFEFSPDLYLQEEISTGLEVRSPFNFGLRYKFDNGVQLSTSVLYGSEIGVTLTRYIDPYKSVAPGGQGGSPPPLKPINQVAALSWNLNDEPRNVNRRHATLSDRLEQQGLRLLYLNVDGETAHIGLQNNQFGNSPQAIGRTVRSMANTLPPSVRVFDVSLMKNGVQLSSVRIQRADLYDLDNGYDGVWKSYSRAVVSDTIPLVSGGYQADAFPHVRYSLGPYAGFSFFDPDAPIRYELGVGFNGDYSPWAGTTFSMDVRSRLVGNLSGVSRGSDSVLPHVRSDWARYARGSSTYVDYLTAEHIWRPRENFYARVTGGLLESMYGGVSAELLWFPVHSRIALGAEANYVVQRGYDRDFSFLDYSTFTGHMSVYYDLPGEYHAQVDLGRYLAGDTGATMTLKREFNNGFKVGAFFTLTDVSFSDFGEGSFDKGITVEVPVSWFTGQPSRNKFAQVIRPVLRDGGARLNVRNRLYEYSREARGVSLAKQWGRHQR